MLFLRSAKAWHRQDPLQSNAVIVGGRYGLSSKEFTPAMVKGVFDELSKDGTQKPLHRWHQRRCDSLPAWNMTHFLDCNPRNGALRLLWSGF